MLVCENVEESLMHIREFEGKAHGAGGGGCGRGCYDTNERKGHDVDRKGEGSAVEDDGPNEGPDEG